MDMQNGNVGEANEDVGNKKTIYSIPGILHFIQHEWSRFEIDRAQWDVERAELQARIAFLQGERKGQENLKRDLIRRIKMLEYALKQERAKVHKLKFGTDLKVEPKPVDSDDSRSSGGDVPTTNSNMTWRHGRQLLRQYLQEVGYSDTILDVRSQRVRALLGSTYDVTNKDNDNKLINGDSPAQDKQKSPDFSPQEKGEPTENDVMKEFGFLTTENDDEVGDDEVDGGDQQRTSRPLKTSIDTSDKYNGAELALAEFAFLNHEEQEIDPKLMDWSVDRDKLNTMKEQFRHEKRQTKRKGMKRPDKKNLKSMIDTLRGTDTGGEEALLNQDDNLPFVGPRGSDESIESAFGLGELAGLTVANEADPLSFEISGSKEPSRRTWNPKFTLRSHFDGVRGVHFLPKESALLTASEDHTLKLWNLNKPHVTKKTQYLDMEPVYCFRGHTAAVLCLSVDLHGSTCFSAGADTTIRCWNIPSIDIDPYDSYDASIEGQALIGHTDAVWSLSYCGSRQQLLSASSDMTVKLWDPMSSDPLLQTISFQGDATPTCVEFVRCDSNQAVASHSDGKIVVLDLESGKTILTLSEGDGGRVNCVATHPTMPVTMSAHDDGHIKFFDNLTGKAVHSMVAHLDSVSCLAVDPNGLYLLSGSHDCSIRLWNLDNKTCIQELTAHRKKFDESIHSVAFHPSASYIASGGADALAKVFV